MLTQVTHIIIYGLLVREFNTTDILYNWSETLNPLCLNISIIYFNKAGLSLT